MSLTDKAIAAAKAGDVINDTVVKGLHLRAFAERKVFYLFFRTKARDQRRPKLGDYPTMTVGQARTLAKELLLAVAHGRDPMVERQMAVSAPTVSELCDKFMKGPGALKKSAANDKRMIDSVVKPKLGKLRVVHVSHDDVADLHASMAKTPYHANRVLALLSRLFTLAEMWRYRPQGTSPTTYVTRYPEKKRRRSMTPVEAAAIGAALQKYSESRPEAVLFIYLLILAGGRKGEAAAARWEWLDGSTLNLPDSKTGAKPVFLPPQVMALLEPRRQDKGLICGIKSPRALWDKIRVEAKCPDLRMHDLRRTFASTALSLGFSLDQIGELLGHSSTQTTARYAWMLPQPGALAAEAVATRLEEMLKTQSSDQNTERSSAT